MYTNKSKLGKEIHTIVERLKVRYKPSSIILFGSVAKGNFKEGSDIDFLVIKKTQKPRHHRQRDIFKILSDIPRDYPCDFVVYTPKELKARFELGDFFIKDILGKGKRLYESGKS